MNRRNEVRSQRSVAIKFGVGVGVEISVIRPATVDGSTGTNSDHAGGFFYDGLKSFSLRKAVAIQQFFVNAIEERWRLQDHMQTYKHYHGGRYQTIAEVRAARVDESATQQQPPQR